MLYQLQIYASTYYSMLKPERLSKINLCKLRRIDNTLSNHHTWLGTIFNGFAKPRVQMSVTHVEIQANIL